MVGPCRLGERFYDRGVGAGVAVHEGGNVHGALGKRFGEQPLEGGLPVGDQAVQQDVGYGPPHDRKLDFVRFETVQHMQKRVCSVVRKTGGHRRGVDQVVGFEHDHGVAAGGVQAFLVRAFLDVEQVHGRADPCQIGHVAHLKPRGGAVVVPEGDAKAVAVDVGAGEKALGLLSVVLRALQGAHRRAQKRNALPGRRLLSLHGEIGDRTIARGERFGRFDRREALDRAAQGLQTHKVFLLVRNRVFGVVE